MELELEKSLIYPREVKENKDRVEKQAGKAQEYLIKDERDKPEGYLMSFNEKCFKLDDGCNKRKLYLEATELERI